MPSVCFVTLSRSDYASLRPVVRAAMADSEIEVKLIAGGSHMLSRFGTTIEQIKKDGLDIHAAAEFLSEKDDSPEQLAAAYARAVSIFVELFTADQPDYVFVLGDRWEMLAVATAASMLQIPIVHHSGGDITQGSSDNQTRYALSCLSHLHLVALEDHRRRLLAMGEEAWRVMTVGEPALTELPTYAALAGDIYEELGLQKGEPFVLATFHPTSFDTLSTEAQIDGFLEVLDTISEPIILTAPNPDAESEIFLRKLTEYADKHAHVQLHESLGAVRYYAAMKHAKYMIGNSSSGLWEAPSFGLPVINIGPRQQGRAHGANVVNVPLVVKDVTAAIRQVSQPAFLEKLVDNTNPYVRADTLELILDALKKPRDKKALLAKKLMDPLNADHSS
ncbi:MAG: UDP-N-acetylglucosamine 2-epimerase [Rickettsiales bacterium]